jgi:hypothetical protein
MNASRVKIRTHYCTHPDNARKERESVLLCHRQVENAILSQQFVSACKNVIGGKPVVVAVVVLTWLQESTPRQVALLKTAPSPAHVS